MLDRALSPAELAPTSELGQLYVAAQAAEQSRGQAVAQLGELRQRRASVIGRLAIATLDNCAPLEYAEQTALAELLERAISAKQDQLADLAGKAGAASSRFERQYAEYCETIRNYRERRGNVTASMAASWLAIAERMTSPHS